VIIKHFTRFLLTLFTGTVLAFGALSVAHAQPIPPRYTILEVIGGASTQLNGINNRGQITGSYFSSDFSNNSLTGKPLV
jgi:hypothetical protein